MILYEIHILFHNLKNSSQTKLYKSPDLSWKDNNCMIDSSQTKLHQSPDLSWIDYKKYHLCCHEDSRMWLQVPKSD